MEGDSLEEASSLVLVAVEGFQIGSGRCSVKVGLPVKEQHAAAARQEV